jgi:hypothetical protein
MRRRVVSFQSWSACVCVCFSCFASLSLTPSSSLSVVSNSRRSVYVLLYVSLVVVMHRLGLAWAFIVCSIPVLLYLSRKS